MLQRFLHIALLLLITLFTRADEKSLDTLVLKSILTSRALPQERVYLHFDNSGYYLGETMWFKAYCMGGNGTNITTPQSKVLYVELCAPEGYVVETKKYKLDDKGCCNGEFELKPSLLSGYYEVRAYTRYMLNWGDDAVFSRVFPVYDKVNGDNYDFRNMLLRKRGFLYRGEWTTQEGSEPSLTFYPEGGNLVSGIETKVAFELRDKGGKPLNDSIYLYADKELLLTTRATHNGKGYFMFTPQPDVKYRANVNQGKKEYTFELPSIEKNGAVISVRHDGDSIRFSVSGNIDGQATGFVILNRNLAYLYKKNEDTLAMHRDKLREGVNRCLLLTADGAPLSERMFFVKHTVPQQGDIVPIKLKSEINGLSSSEKTTFKPYRKLTVKIAAEDGTPLPKNGCYSVAVTGEENNILTSYSNNIYTQMLLSSELKGYIPDASQYFADDNENTRNNLDLLMLTHGWTAYDWTMLAGTDTCFTINHPIEKGIQVKGSFMKKEKVKKLGKLGTFKITPLKGVNVRFDISYRDSIISNYDFITGDKGKFTLELNDFYGKKYASLTPVLTSKQALDTLYKFSLDKYFSPKFHLFDYWQCTPGSSIEQKRNADKSLMQLGEINELDAVDIIAKKYKGRASRPPKSEIRLDFMDEWEYAQDVSYIYTPNDNWISYKVNDVSDILERAENDESAWQIMNYIYDAEGNYRSNEYVSYVSSPSTGIWRATHWEGPRHYAYKDVLTAFDVLQSAFWRYNYNWAYWVKLIVVEGDYESNKIPLHDVEYLNGKNPTAMMNFKEFVIRNDEKIRDEFVNNSDEYISAEGKPLNSPKIKISRTSYLNKGMYRPFYYGFLLKSSITPQDDKRIDGYPGHLMFRNEMRNGQPNRPNYVACFIPNKEEDRVTEGIIPELAVKTTMRYTRVQGYSRSKRFYSPDYTNNKPTKSTKDYRRTLLWNSNATVGEDGCITLELHNGSNECIPRVDIWGMNGNAFFVNE